MVLGTPTKLENAQLVNYAKLTIYQNAHGTGSPALPSISTPLRIVHLICKRFVFEASWTTRRRKFLDLSCVYTAANFAVGNAMYTFPILCRNFSSRRAHLLGSKVMLYLPRFNKPLFHPSISGTFLWSSFCLRCMAPQGHCEA